MKVSNTKVQCTKVGLIFKVMYIREILIFKKRYNKKMKLIGITINELGTNLVNKSEVKE